MKKSELEGRLGASVLNAREVRYYFEVRRTLFGNLYCHSELYVWSHILYIARVRINRVVSKVANPARGQLNRENELFPVLVPFAPENLVSRDGFGSPVPRRPVHLRIQA